MIKKLVSLSLAFIMLFSGTVTAFADDSVEEVTVSFKKADLAENPAAVIEKALKQAKNKTNISLTVNVPSGTYTLTSGLHIYSNTTLNLKSNTKFVRSFSSGSMLKCGTQNDVNTGYDGYVNISVSGGIWDNNYTEQTCCMRFAHCQNVSLKNMIVKNVFDSHHIEIGAADNMTLDGLTVKGYKRQKNTSGEAVQIDPVHSSEHFKGYQLLDDTPCKNITVKNCLFQNVFSGVGTRSGVVGSYFDNMKIINNTFTNISDKAICTFNYINSQISGNVINNASVGIFFEEYPTRYVASKLYMPFDKSASTKVITDINTKINNNTISVHRNSNYAQSCGIGIYGGILSKDTAKKTGLKNAKYLVKNVTVTNNNITVNTASSCGMEFKYMYDSKVLSNTVVDTAKANKHMNGIRLFHSEGNKVGSNKLSGTMYQGISLYSGSANNNICSNTVKGARKFGVAVFDSAQAVILPSNSISSNTIGAVFVKDKNVQIPGIKGKIAVVHKSSYNLIKWKKSKTASGYYIYRASKKDGEYTQIATVKNRKITSYIDKTGKKYFYKVSAYKLYNKSVIIGRKAAQ